MTIKQFHSFFISLLFCLTLFLTGIAYATPKNIIFMIGDGMGFEEVKAAGMYLNGQPGTLSFESLPYSGEVTTSSASPTVTDSAAAGTALATGNKAYNGVISMANPGDGSELQTLLEYFRDMGKMTGLVTTSYMTDATPAAFGAHETSRDNTSQIAADYRLQTKVNVLLGGGGNGMASQDFIDANYVVVTNAADMLAVDTENTSRLCGLFGSGQMRYEADGIGNQPHLSEMAMTALNILDGDPNGFFLMVEGGNIDHAGHSSDLEKNVFETIEFHNSVQLMLNWAAERDDTLVIVTADHETGGLHVVTNNGAGVLPTVNWTGGGNHTSANVPIYAWGKNAQLVGGVMDNTQMFWVCTSTPGTGAWGPVPEDGAILELDTFATLSWYPRIDAVSHNIYFGPSFDDVNDANDSALLINQSETACTVGKVGSAYPDALVPGTMYYWRVDEVNDIDPNNPYEGLVWSFFVPPVIAWNANPADGQKFVDPNVVLSWSKALGVKISDAHALYFGQDYNDVFDGNDNTFLGITDDPSYGLEMLEKDNIYYWRVDETIGSGRTKYVNKGDVWSFTVNEYLVLDDFEDYNDYSPDRVSDSWTGGADDPSNGAVVGYTDPNLAAGEHYAETKIVNSGGQSMPIFYDNNSMYSEASVTISSHRNWTEPNLPVLSIMFRGNKKNAPEPMYAAICNNPQTIAAVYHSDPNAVLLDKWTQWDIDLLSFTDMDIDLTNVDKLFIGFGDPADIKQDGGSGLVYFDNIRLYKPVEP